MRKAVTLGERSGGSSIISSPNSFNFSIVSWAMSGRALLCGRMSCLAFGSVSTFHLEPTLALNVVGCGLGSTLYHEPQYNRWMGPFVVPSKRRTDFLTVFISTQLTWHPLVDLCERFHSVNMFRNRLNACSFDIFNRRRMFTAFLIIEDLWNQCHILIPYFYIVSSSSWPSSNLWK